MPNRPKYNLRVSPRSKWVRLVMSLFEGLTVVVPNNYDLAEVDALLFKKQQWIEKHTRRFKRYKKYSPVNRDTSLPDFLELHAIGERWAVKYEKNSDRTLKLNADTTQKQIIIRGRISSKKACREVLKEWLRKKAKLHLVARTLELSVSHNLPVNKIAVRCQNSRWGSCSSKKNINLNLKLLFFSPALADYVIIHELCHTVHLNHSKAYWLTVADILPNYRELHAEAKYGSRLIPGWLC